MVIDMREGVLLVNRVVTSNGRVVFVVFVVVAPLRDAGEQGAEEQRGTGQEGGEHCWQGFMN